MIPAARSKKASHSAGCNGTAIMLPDLIIMFENCFSELLLNADFYFYYSLLPVRRLF